MSGIIDLLRLEGTRGGSTTPNIGFTVESYAGGRCEGNMCYPDRILIAPSVPITGIHSNGRFLLVTYREGDETLGTEGESTDTYLATRAGDGGYRMQRIDLSIALSALSRALQDPAEVESLFHKACQAKRRETFSLRDAA